MRAAEGAWVRGRISWEIGVAARAVADAAAELCATEHDPALVEALLADQYRDAGVAPLTPRDFALLTASLDRMGWLRFTVIIGALGREELRAALPAVSRRMAVGEQIDRGMVRPAQELQAVDLRMLASSPVRAEELARRMAAGLGIAIEGETRADSAARLRQIDYTRLLANVEAVRASAEERLRRETEKSEAEVAAMVEALLRPWKGLPYPGSPAGTIGPPPRSLSGLSAREPPGQRRRPRASRRLVDEAAAWAEKQVAKLLKCQEAQDERLARRRKKG